MTSLESTILCIRHFVLSEPNPTYRYSMLSLVIMSPLFTGRATHHERAGWDVHELHAGPWLFPYVALL